MSELIKAMIDQRKKNEDQEKEAEDKIRVEKEEARKKEKESRDYKKATELKLRSVAESSTRLQRVATISKGTPRGQFNRNGTISYLLISPFIFFYFEQLLFH